MQEEESGEPKKDFDADTTGTFEFGVAECHDGMTRCKTERGALSTNMWPNLGGDPE